MLRHGFANGRVETALQDVEFLGGDWRLLFQGTLNDGLAQCPIEVDDLQDGIATEDASSQERVDLIPAKPGTGV